MEEGILQSICIRLADGRSARLEVTAHLDGMFETVIITDASEQEKVFSTNNDNRSLFYKE